ncbi:class I SAM-dependent methyltransferase [Portibacter lacus]|nr:class I SAM-dependent methyltransferase [Portibacter lacus]
MQKETSVEFVMPFVQEFLDLSTPKQILEIGCAEAGVLKAFTEKGHQCTGIELLQSRVDIAETFFEDELASGQIKFVVNDIMKIDIENDIGHRFDLIILKDVIEHIPNQGTFIEKLRSFLNPGGLVFFGFPPWQMPFGGHQQIASNKYLSKLPYYHLLPKSIYKGILTSAKEKDTVVQELLEIKDTGISIERFQSIAKSAGYKILKRKLFLINPIYKYKFNLKPRKQLPILKDLPYFRNYLSTCAYFLITIDD